MEIFWLDERIVFPGHQYANKDGILAVGGDLSLERLLLAYSNGIFPWYNEDEVIIWWSPHERFVLYFDELRIPRSLHKFMKKCKYKVTYDTAFEQVITACRNIRKAQGTWITEDMRSAYISMYKEGFAHSVEVWQENELVGGLYGVSLGSCFCGESMFTVAPNASKIALVELCKSLESWGFKFIDCQVHTAHLEKLGAKNIKRDEFLKELEDAMSRETIRGKW